MDQRNSKLNFEFSGWFLTWSATLALQKHESVYQFQLLLHIVFISLKEIANVLQRAVEELSYEFRAQEIMVIPLLTFGKNAKIIYIFELKAITIMQGLEKKFMWEIWNRRRQWNHYQIYQRRSIRQLVIVQILRDRWVQMASLLLRKRWVDAFWKLADFSSYKGIMSDYLSRIKSTLNR